MGPRTGRGATGRSGGRGRGEASALVACGGVGRRLGPLARAPLHPRRPRAVASPTAAWGGHPRGGAPTAPAHARTSTSAGMADECPCGDACSAAGFPPPPPPACRKAGPAGMLLGALPTRLPSGQCPSAAGGAAAATAASLPSISSPSQLFNIGEGSPLRRQLPPKRRPPHPPIHPSIQCTYK